MIRVGDATLYTGDVLSVLAELPEESVHCVVTSPPYWGLRDYGIPPTVWDGESGCAHEWGEQVVTDKRGLQTSPSETLTGPQREDARKSTRGAWCQKCGAWLGSHGLEPAPELYVQHEVHIFRAVHRVLRKDGTLWLNLGASYAGSGKGPSESLNKNNPHSHEAALAMNGSRGVRIGSVNGESGHTSGVTPPPGFKPKDMIPIPWMVAMALQADGWYLRSDIIWAKPNPMPESVTDRPTKAHEYLFLLSKSGRYFYDAEAIREAGESGPSDLRKMEEGLDRIGGKHKVLIDPLASASSTTHIGQVRSVGIPGKRNRRTVWTIATEPYPLAHFATFPRKLVQPCILAGCPEHACPKCGAPWVREVEKSGGTTGRDWNAHRKDGERLAVRYATDGATGDGTYRVSVGPEHPTCSCSLPAIGGTVLDPFGGSGTTAEVALEYGRRAILIELKPEYVELQKRRLAPVAGRPLLDFVGGTP